MSKIIYLDRTSKLNRFYVHPTPLPGNVPARSVEQLYGFLVAQQSNRPEIASEILQDGSLYEREPERICTYLETKGIGQEGSFVFARKEIYKAILLDQVARFNSPIRDALSSYVQDDEEDAFFVMCSTSERVWSCGLSKSKAERSLLHNMPGANIYGVDVLGAAVNVLQGDNSLRPKWDVALLAAGPVGIDSTPVKTCLLVSDSMCKYIKHIDGGDVMKKSGAKFSDMIEILQTTDDLDSYAVIVVHCGINVVQKPYIVEQEVESFSNGIKMVRQACPNSDILISLPLRHEDVDVPNFNEKVRSSLSGVQPLEFMEAVEPFWKGNRRNMSQYNVYGGKNSLPDEFHLNRNGTAILWWKMTCAVPLLKEVRMNLGKTQYQEDSRPGNGGIRSCGRLPNDAEPFVVLEEAMVNEDEDMNEIFEEADEIQLIYSEDERDGITDDVDDAGLMDELEELDEDLVVVDEA